MFSRAFMRNFNSNKYMNPIRQCKHLYDYVVKAGESKYFFPARDMPYFRFMLTGFVVLTTYLAYNDPSIFHEVFFHMHYPTHGFDVPSKAIQVISRGVPD